MSTLTASITSKARDFPNPSLPQANTFSCDDDEKIYDSRIFDYLPHVADALIHSIAGIFIRIIQIPSRIVTLFAPVIQIYLLGFMKEKLREMTHVAVKEGFFDPDKCKDNNIPSKEKLHWMIYRVNFLAKELGIKQEIAIYSTENSRIYGATAGSTFSCTAIPVILSRDLLNISKDEIEAVLTHELTHVAHNHMGLNCLYSLAVLVADVAVAIFVSPFAIPLIEGLASPLNNFLSRANEKDADLNAIKILNSNTGALKFFERTQQISKNFRSADADDVMNHPEKFPPFDQLKPDELAKKIEDRKMVYSPEGNVRLDLKHPALTERIAYIKAFKPVALEA